MSIIILSVDMDGTCINSRHKINDKTINSLIKAKETGIEIVTTMGRSLNCLPLDLRNRGLYRYVISSKGEVINDTQENKIYIQNQLINLLPEK